MGLLLALLLHHAVGVQLNFPNKLSTATFASP